MEEVLSKSKKKVILLGNEAIVRGALESGVQFVSTYPGTPASEIGDAFYKISKCEARNSKQIRNSKFQIPNFYFEHSTNEKVALEAGIGASYSGLKTLVAMKSFGLNVCLDALIPFVYTGCVGPAVIVVADDPGCHSSAQSEQDSRAISYLAHIPTLEPSDPQECRDFTKLAFEISQKFNVPVMIQTTTRVAHQRMPVKLEKLNVTRPDLVAFEKNVKRFVTMPPRVLEMKKELLEKIEKIQEFSEKSKINFITNYQLPTTNYRIGIIASGISYLYVLESLKEVNLKLPVLKLGFFYPFPERKIKAFIKDLEKVFVVEELEPYLEKEIVRLVKEVSPELKIYGKNLIPEVGELNPDIVISAVAKFVNWKLKTPHQNKFDAGQVENSLKIENWKLKIPSRRPQFCSGCPYWLIFGAIRQALKQANISEKDVVFGGDIGCYMLAGLKPIGMQDYLLCMGSSIGIAHGVSNSSKSKVKNQKSKIIAFIGDSTFFHAGIPALINTIFNHSNPLIIIMDNLTTAMTGHQPHPGRKIKIEDVVKGCGVKNFKVIDPINQKEMIRTIREFLNKKEVSVIVARRACIFVK